jgi:protein-tyrosine-phosphatase
LVDKATHLFGMTAGHREAIEMLFPEAREKVFVLREFIVEGDLDLDVPDPIGMDMEAYERARNLIKEAMPSILEFITRPTGGDLPPQEDDDPQHSS